MPDEFPKPCEICEVNEIGPDAVTCHVCGKLGCVDCITIIEEDGMKKGICEDCAS